MQNEKNPANATYQRQPKQHPQAKCNVKPTRRTFSLPQVLLLLFRSIPTVRAPTTPRPVCILPCRLGSRLPGVDIDRISMDRVMTSNQWKWRRAQKVNTEIKVYWSRWDNNESRRRLIIQVRGMRLCRIQDSQMQFRVISRKSMLTKKAML